MSDIVPEEAAPVAAEETRAAGGSPAPEAVGLCLSGGGYRAMLFHVGALIRLNQLGMVKGLARVSSVSGGSLVGGVLGLGWSSLQWDAQDRATNLDDVLIAPITALSRETIDVRSFLSGLFSPFKTVGDFVAAQYDKHLFHGATLQDLPSGAHDPRFVINATSVQTGKLVRFSQPYIADYTVGMWRLPKTSLARAVAASSAFPPVLSPVRVRPSGEFDAGSPPPIHAGKFRDELVLTDGGVYDNLGLQTAWSRCTTLLVSDGGGALSANAHQPSDWARHGVRVTEVIDSQVRALRKRQLIAAYQSKARHGTYWGISSATGDFPVKDPLPFTHDPAGYPADVPTRLAAVDDKVRRDLIRWGYTICDTAIRSWVRPGTPPPASSDIPD